MTPDEKFNEPCQSPTFPLLRLSSGRFGRNLCARLCARIEKSTYIQWRKCFIFRAPPVGLEPTTLWLTVINIFSIPFLWRYRKHWNSGITRDSKRVFGIFRTKNSSQWKALPGNNSLNLIWFIYSIYIRPFLQNVYSETLWRKLQRVSSFTSLPTGAKPHHNKVVLLHSNGINLFIFN